MRIEKDTFGPIEVPAERLWVDLRVLEPTRRLFIFQASGARALALLEAFRGSANAS